MKAPHERIKEISLQIPKGHRYLSVAFPPSSLQSESEKAALAIISFSDSDGVAIEPSEDLNISKEFGPYVYLTSTQIKSGAIVDVSIPENASMASVGIVNWDASVPELPSTFELETAPSRRVPDFDIIDADHPLPIDDIEFSFQTPRHGEATLSWSASNIDDGQSLLLFSFLDDSGMELMPPAELAVHPELGPYVYANIAVDDAEVPDEISEKVFTIPPNVSTLKVRGIKWKGQGASFTRPPRLHSEELPDRHLEQQHEEWLNSVTATDNILVIHTTAAEFSEANKLLLRSNRMAIEMASHGWKVVYVPFSNAEPLVINPGLLQVGAHALMEVFNELNKPNRSGRSVYLCSSRSDLASIALIDRIKASGWKVVYETRDDMEEFQRVGYAKWYRAIFEQRTAERSDLIIATAPRLRERISTIAPQAPTALLPNAAPDDFIQRTEKFRTLSHFNEFRNRPVIGYLGHLTGSWFDWPLVLRGMRERPHYEFEIIGHGIPDSVELPSNARHLGAMAHAEAIERMAHWRVGLIPFQVSRLTFGVDPNKIYEYIAAGLPTVSAPMGSVEAYPATSVYRNFEEFLDALDFRVSQHLSESDFDKMNQFVEINSWKYRMAEFAEMMENL